MRPSELIDIRSGSQTREALAYTTTNANKTAIDNPMQKISILYFFTKEKKFARTITTATETKKRSKKTTRTLPYEQTVITSCDSPNGRTDIEMQAVSQLAKSVDTVETFGDETQCKLRNPQNAGDTTTHW